MPKATFSSPTAQPLTFSVNPRYPGKITINPGMVRGRTEGGEDCVYEKAAPFALIDLKFADLPASDFDGGFDYSAATQTTGTQSLVNWFLMFGAGGAFTYTDPFGRSHTVSLTTDHLDFALTEFGLYDGSLTLKEQIG